MNDLFPSPSEACAFIRALIEDQTRVTGTPLTEFERQLLALKSDDLIETRLRLAERFGVTDSGRSAINHLTEIVRSSRKNKSVYELHPSGKTVDELLRGAEQMLQPTTDFCWLIVRDSRYRATTKLDQFFAKALIVVLAVGLLGSFFWKVAHVGGIRLTIIVSALLLVAMVVDVFRRRAMRREAANS